MLLLSYSQSGYVEEGDHYGCQTNLSQFFEVNAVSFEMSNRFWSRAVAMHFLELCFCSPAGQKVEVPLASFAVG